MGSWASNMSSGGRWQVGNQLSPRVMSVGGPTEVLWWATGPLTWWLGAGL